MSFDEWKAALVLALADAFGTNETDALAYVDSRPAAEWIDEWRRGLTPEDAALDTLNWSEPGA